MQFWGYKRKEGRAGIRNHVLILPTCACGSESCRIVASQVRGAVNIVFNTGCSDVAANTAMSQKVLTGFACNPNVYGVVIIGLGCETVPHAKLREKIQAMTSKPVVSFGIQEEGGTLKTIEKAVRAASKMAAEAAMQPKELCDISELMLGIECGGSDATSGIASNPAVGELSDLLVDLGATTMMSESIEWIGGEHLLAKRAATPVSDSGAQFSSQTIHAGGPCCTEWLTEFSEIERGAQDWLDQVVGHLEAPLTLDTPLHMATNGTPLADLFNTVQLAASGAQISVTSLANDAAGLPQTVRRRDILNAYPYTNTLTILQITGAVLRRAMERSAEYFIRNADGTLRISDAFLKPKVEHYNYDYYAGVHYVFDCSRPIGQRVTELCVNGRPVADDDVFTACLSSYRASGTGGYDCYVGCPVLREIGTEMSDLLLDFFQPNRPQPTFTHCDFRVI